jgi:hypothetical protein
MHAGIVTQPPLVLDFSCLRTGVRVVVVSIEKEYNIYFGVVL